MKNLAIIPARGGSKRLENKNLRKLGGKPLVAHTLEAASESGHYTKILLSSDDEDILSVADDYDEVTPDRRPEELATDKAKARDVVQELVSRDEHSSYDTVSLLLPTAPFRTSTDIKAAFELLNDDCDSVVSITDYNFNPKMSMRVDDEDYVDPVFNPSPLVTGHTRSQDQEKLFRPNGGIYLGWLDFFQEQGNFFKGTVRAHHMPPTIDIDTPLDLKYARLLVHENKFDLEQDLS